MHSIEGRTGAGLSELVSCCLIAHRTVNIPVSQLPKTNVIALHTYKHILEWVLCVRWEAVGWFCGVAVLTVSHSCTHSVKTLHLFTEQQENKMDQAVPSFLMENEDKLISVTLSDTCVFAWMLDLIFLSVHISPRVYALLFCVHLPICVSETGASAHILSKICFLSIFTAHLNLFNLILYLWVLLHL